MHPFEVPTVPVDGLPADAVLLDCREHYEWTAGHIHDAVHVPMNELPRRLSGDAGPLTSEKAIVVVCKMGGRSAHVTAWLNNNGFNAVNLDGGMLAWATSGRTMISENGEPPRVA